MEPEELARGFYEAYARLAPRYNHQTRPEEAVAWKDVPEPNRALMIAACEEIIRQFNLRERKIRSAGTKTAD